MNLKTISALFNAFYRTIGYLFLYIFFGLILDSSYFASYFEQSQYLATLALIAGFIIVYYRSGPRIREQMLYAVAIGFVGEHLFSIVLGMYTYRLGNVPLYIPFGHAIVYIAVVYFCKKSIIKEKKSFLERMFALFVIIYATAFLIFANDIFGFIMSMLVLFLLRNKPRERLFYLTMYIVVVFLEIVGTTYNCWYWPETAFDKIPFLQSANPPSGISLFYFLLDLGSLWLYKKRHKIAWSRMKNIRKINLNR
jgi:hypothetical protein